MGHISLLPPEIVGLIIEYLEYASEVNALAQTSRCLFNIATSPFLYPRYAKLCSPHGVDRLVANGDAQSLRRLAACGVDLKKYLDYGRGLEKPNRRSPVEVAASNGLTDVLQAFRDICGHDIVRPDDLNIAIEKGDLDVLTPFFNGELSAEVRKKLFDLFIDHAASHGSVASIKCMIDGGLDVDLQTPGRRLTPLISAAAASRLDIVECLLEAGADCNRGMPMSLLPGRIGRGRRAPPDTPLYHAAISRTSGSSEALVRYLLDHGARLIESEIDFLAPIPEALIGGNSLEQESTSNLKEQKALADLERFEKARARETLALSHISICGAEDIAQLLMDESDFDFETRISSSSNLEKREQERDELLCFAIGIDDEGLVRRLLGFGKLHSYSSYRVSPTIKEAAKRGRSTILKLLLDKLVEDMDRHLLETGYKEAVSVSVCNNQIQTLLMILDHGGDDLLSLIANHLVPNQHRFEFGDEIITSILVERGMLKFMYEGNPVDRTLQGAMGSGNYKFTTQIMRHFDLRPSYRPRIGCPKGSSLFELAAQFGPIEGFETIVSLGVDIKVDDIACTSALFHAASGLQPLIIQAFLDKGFSVNAVHTTDATESRPEPFTEPLIVRVADTVLSSKDDERLGRLQSTIRLLLERGVDIDAVTSKGDTAFGRAVNKRFASIECVQQLLNGGANPFLKKCRKGRSALGWAIDYHHCEIVKACLDIAAANGYQHNYLLGLIPTQSISEYGWQSAFWRAPDDTMPGRIHDENILSEKSLNKLQSESWADVKRRIEASGDLLQYPTYWERFFIIKEMRRYYWRARYPITEDSSAGRTGIRHGVS